MPTLLSYTAERRYSSRQEEFGRRRDGGSRRARSGEQSGEDRHGVPLLTFGLPTSATAAVLLAGLRQFGIQPSRLLFGREPALVWGVIASLYVGSVILSLLVIALVVAISRRRSPERRS